MLVCLLFTFGVKAQITREQADAIVTDQIFFSNLDDVDIYAFPNVLTDNEAIDLADGTSVDVPYHTCYAYFIDLMPFANWSHPCKYCFVNTNGNHTTVDAQMSPSSGNLLAISLKERPNFTLDLTIPENAHRNSFESGNMDHKWAFLICGNHHGGANPKRFWFDLSSVYTVLTNVYHYQEPAPENEYDYGKRRVFVTAPDGVGDGISTLYIPNNDDYRLYYSSELNENLHAGNFMYNGDFINNDPNDYDDIANHSKENIHNIFECFATGAHSEEYRRLGYELRELTEEDELFIYITGHGSMEDDNCYFSIQNSAKDVTYEKIFDEELTEWLRGIKCSQITLVMQNCNSGGFIEKFLDDRNNEDCQCKNRIGQSAASADGVSLAEGYGIYACMGKDDDPSASGVNEFTYYWTAAALGYYPYYQLNQAEDLVVVGPWTPSGRNIADGSMNWSDYFDDEQNNKHSDYEHDPDTDADGVLSFKELFDFANNLDSWSWNGYYNPNIDSTNMDDPYTPEFPQEQYESTFTAEAATLRGYEGQVDGLGVNSGTATQPYRLCGDLWVGPDSDLTMWDDIYSPEDVKIYIEPTGMLTMDGCTFDKLPETDRGMWQGVQVWGNKNLDQGSHNRKYKQGYLEMKNGATISNAIVGVDLWDPWDYQTTGGIIKATDANFINNAKGVRIEEYLYYYPDNNPATGTELNYNSSFTRCRFEVNGDFIGTEPFYEHVKLSKVKGITFNGCEFILRNPNSHVATWAKGLLAHDASFSINSSYDLHSNLIRQAVFDGLYMGVEALGDITSSITTRSFSIKNTDFANNDCGVFARATGFPTVINCNFAVGRGDSDCAMGIYAEGINDFAIENNHFEPAQICPDDSFGIVVKDSNTSGTQIYQNDFESLYCGNLAIGENRIGEYGLEYRCNQNALNSIDFYVQRNVASPINGVKPNQGSESLAADNTFSIDGYHFYNEADETKMFYYYQKNAENEEPMRISSSVNKSEVIQTDNCPSHYGNGGGSSNGGLTPVLSDTQKHQREMDYYNAYSTYNSVKNLYDRLTDGGSTHSTVADIRTASSYDMWDLRAKLLGASPYLSEEVLKEAADRDDVFTESVLFEILASNPDELRKSDIISYVENKTHPLPQYMTDILKQMANGTTYKTVLLNQMANYSHDYRLAAADMVRSILNDSVVDVDELRGWLSNMNDIASDREIISTYMAEGDFNTAFSLADMLPSLYHLEGDDLDAHDDYMELLRLYRNLYNEGRNTMQMDSTEIALVETIAYGSNGTPKHMAQSILEGAYRYHFEECPIVPYPGNERGGCVENIDPQSYGKAMGLNVDVKPNPATTWVAVDFTLPGDAKDAMLVLTNTMGVKFLQTNLNGNVGQKVLDLREFANGVYMLTVQCGECSHTEKLVITK